MTNTPETDAEFAKKRTFPSGLTELKDFASKLERERDDAREWSKAGKKSAAIAAGVIHGLEAEIRDLQAWKESNK